MHYTTSYEGLEQAEKDAKAMQDVIGYLGQPCVDNLTREVRKTGQAEMPLKDFTMAMSVFAGVEGYPVEAFYNYIFPS